MTKNSKSRGKDGFNAPWTPPLTVSAPALVRDNSDIEFRSFLNDLYRTSVEVLRIREVIAGLAGLTAPRYVILMHIAYLQAEGGVSVKAIAGAMGVKAPFVVTEVNHLIQAGLVLKRKNLKDRRGVLLSLTSRGRRTVEQLAPQLRMVHDQVFGELTRKEFLVASRVCRMLVRDLHAALKMFSAIGKM